MLATEALIDFTRDTRDAQHVLLRVFEISRPLQLQTDSGRARNESSERLVRYVL